MLRKCPRIQFNTSMHPTEASMRLRDMKCSNQQLGLAKCLNCVGIRQPRKLSLFPHFPRSSNVSDPISSGRKLTISKGGTSQGIAHISTWKRNKLHDILLGSFVRVGLSYFARSLISLHPPTLEHISLLHTQ